MRVSEFGINMDRRLQEAEQRVAELLSLNESLHQDHQRAKEEIFDLKMCMATSEAESIVSMKKELEALRSQLQFKVLCCCC